MTALLTTEDFGKRCKSNSLPLQGDGETLDEDKITVALQDATGIIAARLPWILDGSGLSSSIPAQFAQALKALCADIALYRLTDAVTSDDDTNHKYAETMAMLDKIDREYQGGLSGPGLQYSAVIDPETDSSVDDSRFFKKGSMF